MGFFIESIMLEDKLHTSVLLLQRNYHHGDY